jgi:N-acetylmuramoyl-L-alanine amidase
MKKFFNDIFEYLKYLWRFYTTTKVSPVSAPQVPPQEPEPEVVSEPELEPVAQEVVEVMDEINEDNMLKHNTVILIDNGHGEETPGKRSPWSACKVPPELPFREYQYCRDVAQKLVSILKSEGYDARLVTPETGDVPLSTRGKRINLACDEAAARGGHALAISIHNNAAGNGKEWKKAYGWSVWTTPGQNNSDILGQCLFEAAEEILKPLGQKTRKDLSDGDGDYEANFAMCRMPKCPAVLTENMFQDCIDEVKFLKTPEGFNAIVEIHHKGILAFIDKMGW